MPGFDNSLPLKHGGWMHEDLDPMLRSWPYEAGSIQARTVHGLDGRLKIQLRLDMGILQMEMSGRPDGQTPFGCESLFDHYEKLARRFEREGRSDAFRLNLEDGLKLQQEGMQYYYRYLALFQLEHFSGVARDTERNLRMFDFVAAHADKPEMAAMFQQYRPYVLMMLTRARATLALQNKDHTLAIKHIEWGLHEIRTFLLTHMPPEAVEQNHELNFLHNMLKEVRTDRPLTPREKLHNQLRDAVTKEDYERAARLRDALRELH